MVWQEFLTEMENILDVPAADLSASAVLSGFDSWDSLAMLAFTIMAGEKASRSVTGEEVRRAVTMNDLYSMLASPDATAEVA